MTPGQPPLETVRLAPLLPAFLVAAACLFNLVAYAPELLFAAPALNDDVFHFGLVQRMNAAWDAGGNPLDTWIAYWGQGFPVPRYYQHLPHFVVVLVYRLLGESVPLHVVYDGLRLTLLGLLPLSFYVGTRRLGATPITAACIALCTPFLAADASVRHFLGFQPRSFVWSGPGLFAQLAAMAIFPLALGSAVRAALDGRRLAAAIAWLGATWLSHLLLGYTACVLAALVLLHPQAAGQRITVALRLGAIYLGTAALAAYLLLPTLLESQWLSRTAWEPAEYWDSYGAPRVLAALVQGGLLDGHRLPVLTTLAGVGALLAAWSWLDRRGAERGFAVLALVIFLVSLALFFGRPTWGRLLELLPFSASLPLHRFICAVQVGGVLLAGLALSQVAGRVGWSRSDRRAALAALLVIALLGPAIAATASFAARNAHWRSQAAEAWTDGGRAVDAALADFAALDREVPGRGYAGASWDWGRDFKIGTVHVYHRWSAHDLPAIGYMYHTMGRVSDLEPSFDPGRRDHYELFNVRHLLAPEARGLPPFAARLAGAPGLAAGVVDTEGYFGVVGSAAFVPAGALGAEELRALNRGFIAGRWHAAGWFLRLGVTPAESARPGETLLAAGTVPDFREPPAGAPPAGRVLSSGGGGDRYDARVELDQPGIVLFRMTYHPNWHAELDGKPAAKVMLAPGYVGVPAPAGEHALVMTYRPPAWTPWLLVAGMAALALIAFMERVSGSSGSRHSRQAASANVASSSRLRATTTATGSGSISTSRQ